jgi:hypothetical protein
MITNFNDLLRKHFLYRAKEKQKCNFRIERINTFSSSCSTDFAISFFCSKTASSSNFGTLALITEGMEIYHKYNDVTMHHQMYV